jgi:SAM-dependent methyltransferase
MLGKLTDFPRVCVVLAGVITAGAIVTLNRRPLQDEQADVIGTAFPSHSMDLPAEVMAIQSLMNLKPGMTYGEVGGGNGMMIGQLGPKVMPGGHVYGTGANQAEISAMRLAVNKAGIGGHTNLYVAKELESGLPRGCCDVIFLRMVYHMLPHPQEYLESFKHSLKPSGKLFILEHNPDNSDCLYTTRGDAKLTVTMMGRTMDMRVVPQGAMEAEAKKAGYKLTSGPYYWEFFNWRARGKRPFRDLRGYVIIFERPAMPDEPPLAKRKAVNAISPHEPR